MKMSRKDAKLLLYAGGILTLLLVYVLVFLPGYEKNVALKIENEELRQEVARREALEEQKEIWREKTAAMQGQIAEGLRAFPAGITEDTVILYADELERQSDMEITGIHIGTANQLYELGQGVFLGGNQVVYTFTVSYEDFKKNVETIQREEEKRNVEQVILSFDSASGKLVGSMTLNLYSVQGTDKTYVAPAVPGMSIGTTNIFGGADSSWNGTEEPVREEESEDSLEEEPGDSLEEEPEDSVEEDISE